MPNTAKSQADLNKKSDITNPQPDATSVNTVTKAPMSTGKLLLKASLLAIFFATVLLVVTGLVLASFTYHRLSQFGQEANLSIAEMHQLVTTGLNQDPIATQGRKNILVLGTDSLDDRGQSPPLTDAIMVISLDLDNAHLHVLSLPRDLWSQEYQTKINALYIYGRERSPDNPAEFPTEVLSEMTDLPIHHTLVVSIEMVSQVIEVLGGINIDVPQGFRDEYYPRPGVDVTQVDDPAILYQTIEFEPGTQHMDADTALAYMRSRQSGGEQGTDLARSERQQLVISSLIEEVTNFSNLTNPKLMGQLFALYQSNFGNQLPVTELISTAKTLWPQRHQATFMNHSLSVYPDDPEGVLEHPDRHLYQNQWVWIIRSPEDFRQEIKTKLDLVK